MQGTALPPIEAESPFYHHDPPSEVPEPNLRRHIIGSYPMRNPLLGIIWILLDGRTNLPLYGHA